MIAVKKFFKGSRDIILDGQKFDRLLSLQEVWFWIYSEYLPRDYNLERLLLL